MLLEVPSATIWFYCPEGTTRKWNLHFGEITLSYLHHTYPTAKKSNFLDFVNAQSKNTHHTIWLTASRNLHSNTQRSPYNKNARSKSSFIHHQEITGNCSWPRMRLNTARGKWKLSGYRKFGKPTSPTWTKSITKLPFQALSLVNKQTITFSSPPAPTPPPPNSMLFSGSQTVSWQASLPTSTLHEGEGGGGDRSNCGRI